MIDLKRLQEKAQRYQIDVNPIFSSLDYYASYLVAYNEKVNLTAITDAQGIEDRHFIDSLLLASQPEIQGNIVDVGTGAGFPGVVIKLYCPQCEMTLMEPTGKRIDFLKSLCEKLEIPVTLVKERAEEAARKQWREQYDVAVARAVASLPQLAEYCLPLVRVGGLFITMKGANSDTEVIAAKTAVKKLGAKLEKQLEFELPDGSLRSLIFYRKIQATPAIYPRNGGKIAKSPLK